MSTEMYLSADQLRGMWKDEFLPSIRREIKTEIQALKSSIKLLTESCDAMEQSQDFISKKYDTVIQALQSSKGETLKPVKLDNKYKEITDLLEEKRDELAQTTGKHEETLYRIECSLDETQQYLRRDCLEVTGVPVRAQDNPNQIVKEIGSLIGVEIGDSDIATAHRLPDTRKVKNRLIVKFLRREKREEVYKKRKNLVGKNTSHLPLVAESNNSVNSKIYINESLTNYRKRLFGRIKEYKRANNVKYLWTSNGKIMFKVNEMSPTQVFITHEEFEDYLDQLSNS